MLRRYKKWNRRGKYYEYLISYYKRDLSRKDYLRFCVQEFIMFTTIFLFCGLYYYVYTTENAPCCLSFYGVVGLIAMAPISQIIQYKINQGIIRKYKMKHPQSKKR